MPLIQSFYFVSSESEIEMSFDKIVLIFSSLQLSQKACQLVDLISFCLLKVWSNSYKQQVKLFWLISVSRFLLSC